jgi:hypothetical protein
MSNMPNRAKTNSWHRRSHIESGEEEGRFTVCGGDSEHIMSCGGEDGNGTTPLLKRRGESRCYIACTGFSCVGKMKKKEQIHQCLLICPMH